MKCTACDKDVVPTSFGRCSLCGAQLVRGGPAISERGRGHPLGIAAMIVGFLCLPIALLAGAGPLGGALVIMVIGLIYKGSKVRQSGL